MPSLAAPAWLGPFEAQSGLFGLFFGKLYALYVAGTILPLFMEVLVEQGFVAACKVVGRDFMALSPIFYVGIVLVVACGMVPPPRLRDSNARAHHANC